MKEVAFVNNNKERWKSLENYLSKSKSYDPEELASLYIQLTDDLAYARSFYPESGITAHLNELALALHQKIYVAKKVEKSRFSYFWKFELPKVMYSVRKELLYSFLIFGLAVIIGFVSQMNDGSFSRIILGDSYVNMTIDNIEKNDPMAVYKTMNPDEMFLMITINNIKVAFLVYLCGVFVSVFSGYLLFSNGIMLGAFQAFFTQYGILGAAAKVIWIHGTLEISAIIIAGAAGIVTGNSLLFPKTYSRAHSLRQGAAKGLKIMLGLVPVFIVAGFLEGFVTRHTQMPLFLSLFIIISSFVFIIWYFVIYPNYLFKTKKHNYAKQ